MDSQNNHVKIKLGGYQPENSVLNRAAEVFGDELKKCLGHRVQYEMNGNMTETHGIKAFDLPGLVERGDLTMCYFASSYLVDRVPELGIFDVPFLIESREKIYAALDGELGDIIKQSFLKVYIINA